MDFKKHKKFSPISEDFRDKIFYKDDKDRLFIILKTNVEGLKYAIDGNMGFGATKSSKNKLRIIYSFIKEKTDNFVLDFELDIDKHKKTIKKYFNQNNLYVAFMYNQENKFHFGFSKSYIIEKEQKELILSMLDENYPVIHKISLSNIKLQKFFGKNYYKYKFDAGDNIVDKFKNYMKKFSAKKENVWSWFSYEDDIYYFFINKKIDNKEIIEKNVDPLSQTAVPFGFTSKKNEIFLLAIDKEGINKLNELSEKSDYKKKYNLWT